MIISVFTAAAQWEPKWLLAKKRGEYLFNNSGVTAVAGWRELGWLCAVRNDSL